MIVRLMVAVTVLAALLPCAALAADPLPAAERQRIEALIAHVEGLESAQFLRNGKSYDPRTAAFFLRKKWESRQNPIVSAEDFIERVATGSSTTGEPYRIRFPGGREIPCRDYLRGELRRLAP